SDSAGRNASEAWAGPESDNADADPPAIWGRPRERGSNRRMHLLDPPGEWARHVGKVVRVIEGDPSWARAATSTSRQAAALAGVAQRRTRGGAGESPVSTDARG